MDKIFQNKIALVTGSGRGIGRAIALHFAQHGADVVINFFRNRAPAEETAREVEKLGARALLVKADVGDLDDLNRLFDEVEKGVWRTGYLHPQCSFGIQPLRAGAETQRLGMDDEHQRPCPAFRGTARHAFDGETRRREDRQHFKPRLGPRTARLHRGRREQGCLGIAYPLSGRGVDLKGNQCQRRVTRCGRDRCAEPFRIDGQPGRHPAKLYRPSPCGEIDHTRGSGGSGGVFVHACRSDDRRSDHCAGWRIHTANIAVNIKSADQKPALNYLLHLLNQSCNL